MSIVRITFLTVWLLAHTDAIDAMHYAGSPLAGSVTDCVPTHKRKYLLRRMDTLYYVITLRFKLGGRPILSADLNVETARSARNRPEV